MSADEFWNGDPWLAADYRAADRLNRQRKSEEMWLQGLYNFRAFSTALANLNFGKKKQKPVPYMEEPIRIIPLTAAEKEAKAEQERQKTIEYFNRLAKKWEKKQNK